MKKEVILSIVRHVVAAAGGILIAKGILTETSALDISGSFLALVAAVWSIFDKTASVSQLEGVARQVLTTIGLFVTFITPELSIEIMGVLSAVLATVLGSTDKTTPVV